MVRLRRRRFSGRGWPVSARTTRQHHRLRRRSLRSASNWTLNAEISMQDASLIRASSFLPELTVLFGLVGAKCPLQHMSSMSPLIRPLRSLANGVGMAWWARVETTGPDVTYWFGPFLTRKGLEACLLYTSPSPRD